MSSSMLEHRLRQKLILMENAVTRIASTKQQLKKNGEMAKQEMRQATGHQLTLLRARELALTNNADNILTLKDQLLTEQLDQLHLAIGACQQGLACLQRTVRLTPDNTATLDAVNSNVHDILHRLSSVDLRPRESPHIAFEADTMSMRRAIGSFGRVVCNNALQTTESLPADLEEYDDDDRPLQHKSFHESHQGIQLLQPPPLLPQDEHSRLLKGALTGEEAKDADQVRHWLGHIKSVVEPEPAVFEDFEIVRNRCNTNASSDQSVEVINTACEGSVDGSELFSNHFSEVFNSPDEHWLLASPGIQFSAPKTVSCLPTEFMKMTTTSENRDFGVDIQLLNNVAKMTITDMPELPANSKKRKMTRGDDELNEPEKKAYEFEAVISKIKHSSNANWLLAKKAPIGSPLPTELTSWLATKKHYETSAAAGGKKTENEKATILTDPTDWHLAKKHYEEPAISLQQLTKTPAVTMDDVQAVVSRQKRFWYPTNNASGTAKEDYWLLKNPMTKTTDCRPMNEMAQNIATWESILGWQAVLEKIHASGDDDWLVPASRNALPTTANCRT